MTLGPMVPCRVGNSHDSPVSLSVNVNEWRTARSGRTSFFCVDFAMMAKALGVESHTVQTMEQLIDLDIPEILSRPGPCLLDIIVDGDQVPPLGSRMKVLTGSIPNDN